MRIGGDIRTRHAAVVLAAGPVVLASCLQEVRSPVDLDKLTSIKVEISSGATGTEASPLPFDAAGAPFTVRLTALNGRGEVKQDFDGPVRISAEPGKITGPQITFAGGEGTASVTLEKAFGKTRIWVEDPATFATGVSGPVWYRGPKIADVQRSTTTVASPFEGERVPIDETSTLVVVGIARDGFYVTDVDAAEWASIYAYTFGAPAGLAVGDRVTNLSGRVSEFLGFTELNNPSWEVAGSAPVPAPVPVTCAQLNAGAPNLAMEKLEAGLITVVNAGVAICGSYPSCPDYDQYRQWTLDLGPCEINVVSRYTLAGFDPLANHGRTVDRMVGTLRHIQFADPQWILEPRSPGDVCCPTCTPALNQGC